MKGSVSARNKFTFLSIKRKLFVLIFTNSASHFGAQSTKDVKLCDWHPHYCLLCSLLLQVWCEIKMWIKLTTQPSPELTVQAVPQKSGEPLADGAPRDIAATRGHHIPFQAPSVWADWSGAATAQVSESICLLSHSSLILELLCHQKIFFSLHSFLCQTASALPFVLTLGIHHSAL